MKKRVNMKKKERAGIEAGTGDRRRSMRLQNKLSSSLPTIDCGVIASSPALSSNLQTPKEKVSFLNEPPVHSRSYVKASFSAKELLNTRDHNTSGTGLFEDITSQWLVYTGRKEGKLSSTSVDFDAISSGLSKQGECDISAVMTLPILQCGVADACTSAPNTLLAAQEAIEEDILVTVFDRMREVSTCNAKSNADCQIQRSSMALSEKICKLANDDSFDVDEATSFPSVNVNGYMVKEEWAPIVSKIFEKHGDIAKNCIAKTSEFRCSLLNELCEVIFYIQGKSFMHNLAEIENKCSLFKDFQRLGLQIDWLLSHLEEALRVKQVIKQYPSWIEQRDKNDEIIKEKQLQLELCKAQTAVSQEKLDFYKAQTAAFQEKENQTQRELDLALAEAAKIEASTSDAKARVQSYANRPLLII